MTKHNFMARALAPLALAFGLQGCIDATNAPKPAEEDPGNPDPTVCTHLPVATTSYKGGDTWGEELTVSLDPATMAYTITIDASVQPARTGTTHTGTLAPLEQECTYSSDESGAVFTLAPGGVLLGGVDAPSGGAFAPLIAFRNTFENAATPTVFNPVAEIYNLIGTHSDGTTMQSYGASGRLRNAGTFQLCKDDSSRFMVYATSCTNTEKGYITYNAARNAFDLYTTDPVGSAVTTGGTLTGSVVIGLVGTGTDAKAVPLQLVRDSATSFGLRLYAPQAALASGGADGRYAIVDSGGSNAMATLSGADYSRGTAIATLTYDTPVIGVIGASGTLTGNLLSTAGILGFIPASGTPVFELGVLN